MKALADKIAQAAPMMDPPPGSTMTDVGSLLEDAAVAFATSHLRNTTGERLQRGLAVAAAMSEYVAHHEMISDAE